MEQLQAKKPLLPESLEELLALLSKYNVHKFECAEFKMESVPLAPINNDVKVKGVMDSKEQAALEAAMAQQKNGALFGIWSE